MIFTARHQLCRMMTAANRVAARKVGVIVASCDGPELLQVIGEAIRSDAAPGRRTKSVSRMVLQLPAGGMTGRDSALHRLPNNTSASYDSFSRKSPGSIVSRIGPNLRQSTSRPGMMSIAAGLPNAPQMARIFVISLSRSVRRPWSCLRTPSLRRAMHTDRGIIGHHTFVIMMNCEMEKKLSGDTRLHISKVGAGRHFLADETRRKSRKGCLRNYGKRPFPRTGHCPRPRCRGDLRAFKKTFDPAR